MSLKATSQKLNYRVLYTNLYDNIRQVRFVAAGRSVDVAHIRSADSILLRLAGSR